MFEFVKQIVTLIEEVWSGLDKSCAQARLAVYDFTTTERKKQKQKQLQKQKQKTCSSVFVILASARCISGRLMRGHFKTRFMAA